MCRRRRKDGKKVVRRVKGRGREGEERRREEKNEEIVLRAINIHERGIFSGRTINRVLESRDESVCAFSNVGLVCTRVLSLPPSISSKISGPFLGASWSDNK